MECKKCGKTMRLRYGKSVKVAWGNDEYVWSCE